VAGTLVTGFVLMDHLSLTQIALWLTAFGIAMSAILFAVCASGSAVGVAILGGGLAAILALDLPIQPLLGQVYEALIYKSVPRADEEFADVVENKSGVITVARKGIVYGGGAYDGMIAVDMLDDPNLLIRPFGLSLFHSAPKNVLMIGLATGAWAQVLANHPALEHLTVVEINPGYLPIIAGYPVVAGLLKNPKVSIVIDDGRRWLNRHPAEQFDAIVQNTTWNYRPNVTNLLSAEYLTLLRRHLRPGGVALYNTTGSLRAQRTACLAFPDAMREVNAMVVAARPLRLDHERLRVVLGSYRINGRPVFDVSDLHYRARLDQVLGMLDPVRQQAADPKDALLEACASILARTQGLMPVTDDNMGEEWGSVQADPALEWLHQALGL
jgi:spermidine synthase